MASSMTTTSLGGLENPLSSLSSGYFSDSPVPATTGNGSFKISSRPHTASTTTASAASTASDQEIVQIPLEQENDDEPNILATKPFNLKSKSQHSNGLQQPQQPQQPQPQPPSEGQGYSHLEWSASIPYNVAEEPDDVQGKLRLTQHCLIDTEVVASEALKKGHDWL